MMGIYKLPLKVPGQRRGTGSSSSLNSQQSHTRETETTSTRQAPTVGPGLSPGDISVSKDLTPVQPILSVYPKRSFAAKSKHLRFV